jgi:hypothetical protein
LFTRLAGKNVFRPCPHFASKTTQTFIALMKEAVSPKYVTSYETAGYNIPEGWNLNRIIIIIRLSQHDKIKI